MRPCGQAKGQDDLFRSRLDQIMTKAHSLPAASRTQVNVFLKDATRSGKWHANYSWLTKPVVVDPTQAIKCRALPTEARAVVDDVLQYGYESRAELRKTLEEELSADKDQARALRHARMIDKTIPELAGPYAPLSRFGSHVAVGRSAEMFALEEAAKNDPLSTEDKRRL